MAGRRQPIEVVLAKNAKHLTKEEIRQRSEQEIKPLEGTVTAPAYLTAKQKKTFDTVADQLMRLKVFGETDVDALARYVTSNDAFIFATKKLRSKEVQADPNLFEKWSRTQERYFKMVRATANDLGLSISARCKLIVPQAPESKETPASNKFKKFEKGDGQND